MFVVVGVRRRSGSSCDCYTHQGGELCSSNILIYPSSLFNLLDTSKWWCQRRFYSCAMLCYAMLCYAMRPTLCNAMQMNYHRSKMSNSRSSGSLFHICHPDIPLPLMRRDISVIVCCLHTVTACHAQHSLLFVQLITTTTSPQAHISQYCSRP